jgi:hypothetical protein
MNLHKRGIGEVSNRFREFSQKSNFREGERERERERERESERERERGYTQLARHRRFIFHKIYGYVAFYSNFC